MTQPRIDAGALCDEDFVRIASFPGGYIENFQQQHLSPASLDLTITSEIYEVKRAIFPRHTMTIEEMLPALKPQPHDIDEPLWVGKMYLIKLQQSLRLAEQFRGRANPKSSIGRIDVHVRLMVDRVGMYDIVPPGYNGDLWVFVIARSFSVKLYEGMPIVNLRLFYGNPVFSASDLDLELPRQPLLYDALGQPIDYDQHAKTHDFLRDGSVMMTLHIPEEGHAGYRCIAPPERTLDLAKANEGKVDPTRYFTPVDVISGDMIYMHFGPFHILSTKESILIPPHLAAEMVPIQPEFGSFISHLAGFFDPGWGYGKHGKGTGRPITLETRAFLAEGITLRRDQPVGRVQLQKMLNVPKVHYDQKASNYLGQSGPQLAKWFKKWPE